MPRTTVPGLCTMLVLLAACEPADGGEWIAPRTVETRNGVTMEQVPLAWVVPAVRAGDVETARCGFSRFRPDGSGQLEIYFAADFGDTHRAFVTVGEAGRLLRYSELRLTGAATTSILVNVPRAPAAPPTSPGAARG